MKPLTRVFAIGALALAAGCAGVSSIRASHHPFNRTVRVTVGNWVRARAVAEANLGMISAQRGLILATVAKDPAEMLTCDRTFRVNLEALRKSLQEIDSTTGVSKTRSLTADVASSLDQWQPHYEEMLKLCGSGDLGEATRIRDSLIVPISDRIAGDARRIVRLESDASDRAAPASRQIALLCRAVSFAGLCAVAGAALLWLVRGIRFAVAA